MKKKSKKQTIIESELVTLIPSLEEDKTLIISHSDLIEDLYPFYKEWFFDLNQFEGYSEFEVIYKRINHPLSWVVWCNRLQSPIGFIVLEEIYGSNGNPLICQADIMGLPTTGKLMTLALNEAIDWSFKNTTLQRIECEVPREICTIKVYESLGFTHEGIKRNALYHKGKPLHVDVLGLLKADYYGKISQSYKRRMETIDKLSGRSLLKELESV